MVFPVAGLPVKAMASTSSLTTSSLPTTWPAPVTKLSRPSGSDVSAIISTSLAATTEVEGAGTQTVAFPVATAGDKYSAGMFTGKFHGVMTP